jgi:hypothetical protein
MLVQPLDFRRVGVLAHHVCVAGEETLREHLFLSIFVSFRLLLLQLAGLRRVAHQAADDLGSGLSYIRAIWSSRRQPHWFYPSSAATIFRFPESGRFFAGGADGFA